MSCFGTIMQLLITETFYAYLLFIYILLFVLLSIDSLIVSMLVLKLIRYKMILSWRHFLRTKKYLINYILDAFKDRKQSHYCTSQLFRFYCLGKNLIEIFALFDRLIMPIRNGKIYQKFFPGPAEDVDSHVLLCFIKHKKFIFIYISWRQVMNCEILPSFHCQLSN